MLLCGEICQWTDMTQAFQDRVVWEWGGNSKCQLILSPHLKKPQITEAIEAIVFDHLSLYSFLASINMDFYTATWAENGIIMMVGVHLQQRQWMDKQYTINNKMYAWMKM